MFDGDINIVDQKAFTNKLYEAIIAQRKSQRKIVVILERKTMSHDFKIVSSVNQTWVQQEVTNLLNNGYIVISCTTDSGKYTVFMIQEDIQYRQTAF